MEQSLKPRKKWLDKINELVHKEHFDEAKKLIEIGTQQMNYELTIQEATRIIANGRPNIGYSFIKPFFNIYDHLEQYLKPRKKWLHQINELAYDGYFDEAKKLIKMGTQKMNYKLTKKEATEIIASCGPDIRYSFVKPLVDLGATFPPNVVELAKRVIDSNDEYSVWNSIPGAIEGFKLAIKVSNHQKGGSEPDYYYKYLKYKHKYKSIL